MAWQTPDTFTSGQILTAASMNEISNDLTVLRGDWAQHRRNSGSFTLNNTAWTNVSTATDLSLAASTGDIVEVSLNALAGSEAVDLYLDVVTVVSGSPVTSFATGGSLPGATDQGLMGWRCESGAARGISGPAYLKLVSGDISASTVTLRLRFRTPAATNKTLFASSGLEFAFTARNHGPVEV